MSLVFAASERWEPKEESQTWTLNVKLLKATAPTPIKHSGLELDREMVFVCPFLVCLVDYTRQL